MITKQPFLNSCNKLLSKRADHKFNIADLFSTRIFNVINILKETKVIDRECQLLRCIIGLHQTIFTDILEKNYLG